MLEFKFWFIHGPIKHESTASPLRSVPKPTTRETNTLGEGRIGGKVCMEEHTPELLLVVQFDSVGLATSSPAFVRSGLEIKSGSSEYQGSLTSVLIQTYVVIIPFPVVP